MNHMFRRIVLLLMLGLPTRSAFALYDATPDADLSTMQGEWRGELSYLDYSGSGKRVTLPTKVFVALAAPSRLVLHYVFDDGPGKTVYSYEQMSFDLARGSLQWKTGDSEKSLERFRILSSVHEAGRWKVVFVNDSKKEPHRYTLEVGSEDFSFQKEELQGSEPATLRNTYCLRRAATANQALPAKP